MRRLSQSIIFVLLICVWILAKAQSDYPFTNGEQTQLINFHGAGCSYKWTNNKPGIGLAASGIGDIPSFTAVNNGTTPIVATITVTPVPASYAYVANANNTLSIIDGVSHQFIKTIGIGSSPGGVAASPDGMRVYVVNIADNTVSVINTADNSKLTDVTVGQFPRSVAVSPDSRWVYVGNATDKSVSVIDAQSNMVVATVQNIPQTPLSIVVSPDGKWVYVAAEIGEDANVYVINAQYNTLDSNIPVPYPENIGMVISPDGNTLYMTSNLNGKVTVVDLVSKTVSFINAIFKAGDFNSSPYGIAINSTGTRLYVAASSENILGVINTADNTVIKTIHINGGVIFNVAISNDDKELYVINRNSNEVEVFDTGNYSQIATITDANFNEPFSQGNFISKGPGCGASPFTFTITVNPSIPSLVAPNTASGTISACAGSPSASPDIQQFTLSGSSLNGAVTVEAPANFEVSLSAGSGYAASLSLNPVAGNLPQQVIYVRAKQSAPVGALSDKVKITSPGAATIQVAVSGTVNALPVVNPLGPRIYNPGDIATAINFTGPGNTFLWSNDNTAIGLGASGLGDIPSFTATNTTGNTIVGNVTVTPIQAGYAFIANKGSHDVSVINTVTGKIVKTVGVGENPYAVAVTPDGSKAFITNLTDKTVSIINTSDFKVKTVNVGDSPSGIIMAPDGSKAYVANLSGNSISVIDVATNAVSFISGVASPFGMAINADGSKLYVTSYSSNILNVVDIATQSISTPITVGKYPWAVILSADGSRIYVSNSGDGSVSVLDATSNVVIKTFFVVLGPTSLAASPDGKELYVVSGAQNSVTAYSTIDYSITGTIGMNGGPAGISYSSDGMLYVTDLFSNSVLVINPATKQIINTIAVENSPTSLGSFISKSANCSGAPVPFTITVNAKQPKITAGLVTGSIIACYGMPSVNPNIQQFTVNGSDLTGDITVTAPPNFEVSLYAGSTYSNSVKLANSGGKVTNVTVYVSSSAAATINTTDFVILTSPGAADVKAAISASITPLPVVDQVTPETYTAGDQTSKIIITGTGQSYTWENGNPAIGLPAYGNGDIPSFTAINAGPGPVQADITVTPSTGSSCNGTAIHFMITVNAKPKITGGPVTGAITACAGSPSASLDLQQFTVMGYDLAGDITATAPANFEVSLSAGSGFSNAVTLANSGGKVTNITVYVRSSASATVNTADYIVLTSPGAADVKVAISATITPIPSVDQIEDKIYTTGDQTSKIMITGTGQGYTWINSNPAIGLPAYGSGDIPAFTATNAGTVPLQADIMVTPLNGSSCNGTAIHFMITVTAKPKITGGPVTGAITACAGSPSASPDLQQFTVNGSSLTNDITVTAPANFEVSLSAGSGFSNAVTLTNSGGKVTNITVYVRSSAAATINTTDLIVLTSPGAADVKAAVSATITPIPSVDQIGDKTYITGDQTSKITITGTGQGYSWTNNNPGIGLPADGVGDIPAFTATNAGTAPVKADIIVTPVNGSCSGTPITFTISVNQAIPPAISNNQPPAGVNTVYGTPSSATTFIISGDRMREGIKIAPPAGVEVSSDGINYSTTIVAGSAGTIPPTTIYLRLAKNAPVGTYGGTNDGNVELTSAGASTIYPQLPASAVTPAAVTVTANAKSKNYGTTLTGGPGSTDFIVNGLQNDETAQTVTIAYQAGSAAADPVQVYPLAVKPMGLTGGTFDLKNYTITYFNADLTVTKVLLEITADNKTKIYKDPNPELTITYKSFVNGETVAQLTTPSVISTTADATSLPGKYPITVTGATSPNYDIKFNNGVLTVRPLVLALRIPNTFTPNGDGINDTWNIVNIEAYPDCTVNVFNRWGQKVYASDGYARSWDGLFNNALLPVSTYYYIIDLKNGTKAYSGDVTIIR